MEICTKGKKLIAFLNSTANERYNSLGLKECGFANGYVAVPRSHPYYGLGMMDDRIISLDVHGGVTFSEKLANTTFDFEHSEVLTEGEDIPYGYWCFGFDTMHCWDNLENCNREYVIQQCQLLQSQLEEAWNQGHFGI